MKRKATFLIILLIGLLVYWKGFYKTYNKSQVYQQANQILILDKKNIQNKIIWKYVTNPSVWNISFSDKKTDSWNWKKSGLKIDDYICLFKADNWYWKTTIADKEEFEETLRYFQLEKEKVGEHFVKIYKNKGEITGIQYHDEVLWSYKSNQTKDLAIATALFLNKEYFDEGKIQPFLAKIHEGGVWLENNSFLAEDTWGDIIINESGIALHSEFQLNKKYQVPNQTIVYDSTSWINCNYVFNGKEKHYIQNSWKDKLKKLAGFSVDSILSTYPEKLSFTLQDVTSRIDTAITYEFDDDFNEIEIIKENTIEEPSFLLSLKGENTAKVWHYLRKHNVIDSQHIFVNMPLVKTQAFSSSNELKLISENYKKNSSHDSIEAIAWFEMNFSKIDTVWYKKSKAKFKEWNQWVSRIEKATLHVQNKEQKVKAKVQVKSKNDFLLSILD